MNHYIILSVVLNQIMKCPLIDLHPMVQSYSHHDYVSNKIASLEFHRCIIKINQKKLKIAEKLGHLGMIPLIIPIMLVTSRREVIIIHSGDTHIHRFHVPDSARIFFLKAFSAQCWRHELASNFSEICHLLTPDSLSCSTGSAKCNEHRSNCTVILLDTNLPKINKVT